MYFFAQAHEVQFQGRLVEVVQVHVEDFGDLPVFQTVLLGANEGQQQPTFAVAQGVLLPVRGGQ
nr:hypothetical protein [Thiorhodovibrio winogradskyi]